MKYNINKISNKDEIDNIYTNFIASSSQKNVFCSKEILKFFFDDLDLYTVCKNDRIKSFIYLLKNKDGFVVSQPFIYSGIINNPKLNMKNARYNNEVFKLNELIVNDILVNYKNININLPINFLDMRPFLWFNYGKNNKKQFHVTPRYTSVIDIKSREYDEVFNEIDDVKKRDINKVLKDQNYRVSNNIDLNLIKKFYKETMEKNKGSFNVDAFTKIFNFIETQITAGKIIQATTYFLEDPLYSVLFLNDEDTSCYLYGSGNVKIRNRYAGSLALWKAIEQSIDRKLSFIDLEGINSPQRGEYKINFGGNIRAYYNVAI